MALYQLMCDVNRFKIAYSDEPERLIEMDGTPQGASWRPLRLELSEEDDPVGDIIHVSTGIAAFSARARTALSDVFEGSGEWLSVQCPGYDLEIFNVTRIIDALDEERSDLWRLDTGTIVEVRSYTFHEGRIPPTGLFRLAAPRMDPPLLTEVVKSRIEEAKLKGFDLRQVFPPLPKAGTKIAPRAPAKRKVAVRPGVEDKPLDAAERVTIEQLAAAARDALGEAAGDGQATVEALATRVDAVRGHAPVEDLAELWGALFGIEVARATGWRWRHLRWASGFEALALVSKDAAYCCLPLNIVSDLLNEPDRTNTLMLLFNMLCARNLPASEKGDYRILA